MLYMLYVESDRYPLTINIKCQLISYWLNLLKGTQTSYIFNASIYSKHTKLRIEMGKAN